MLAKEKPFEGTTRPFLVRFGVMIAVAMLVAMAWATPADAGNKTVDANLRFSWQSSGAFRSIDQADHDHNAYSHKIEGNTQFRRSFNVYSRFRDNGFNDVYTGWLFKARCVPNAALVVSCTAQGTMGDRWDDQQLFYRSVDGCCPNNKRVEFDGKTKFKWNG